jgi:hypothetical protein
MSGRMQITFAADMPPATVEVVTPNLESVGRMWIAPGERKSIDVPSEATFLRVHLGDGQIVTLDDPGNLDRHIDRAALTPKRERERIEPVMTRGPFARRRLESKRRLRGTFPPMNSMASPTAIEGVDVSLQLSGVPLLSHSDEPGTELEFGPEKLTEPLDLRLSMGSTEAHVRLPGFIDEVVVRSDRLENGKRMVTVRVRSSSPTADTIGGYLHRGDLHSAAAMAEWAAQARELLQEKRRNPFSAAAGAYLLLRLRDFDRMKDWARNLANWFPYISDGSIIWATQLILQRQNESELRDYLQSALARPLPVFTEGLRLLRDGLRLAGMNDAVQELNQRTGVVLWDSPFTAMLRGERTESVVIDIDYAPPM